jgi:hypothetical protein
MIKDVIIHFPVSEYRLFPETALWEAKDEILAESSDIRKLKEAAHLHASKGAKYQAVWAGIPPFRAKPC